MTYNQFIQDKPASEGKFNPIARDGTHVAFATAVVGVQYNTNFVKGSDVPKKIDDVLNPKWKGKIASTPYAAGLREFATPDFLGRERVVDFTRKLSKQIAGRMRSGEGERIRPAIFLDIVGVKTTTPSRPRKNGVANKRSPPP